MIVVILGTDGCGKSSVVERLERDLAKRFAEVRVLHLRPRLGKGGPSMGAPVPNPHGVVPRGSLMSIVKLLYLVLDYGTLYPWIRRQRRRAGAGLLLFDRYYHDLLVDPRRYRYGAPMWVARVFSHLVPKPDLWILLDAPVEVIRARKREVSPAELVRQQRTYRALIDSFPNSHVVDAAMPIEDVTRRIEGLILASAS